MLVQAVSFLAAASSSGLLSVGVRLAPIPLIELWIVVPSVWAAVLNAPALAVGSAPAEVAAWESAAFSFVNASTTAPSIVLPFLTFGVPAAFSLLIAVSV